MKKLVINCETGEERIIDLTADESAELSLPIPIQRQIDELTSQITPEVLMNYTLGIDGGFLPNLKLKIDALRSQLNN